ncbi:MAG: hypothetical protein ACJAVR_002572 [Paracoccaceae bacterium]|jgi:hypothetical protein
MDRHLLNARASSRRLLRKSLPGSGIMPCSRHGLGHRHAAPGLTQDAHDLGLGAAAFSNRNILNQSANKIRLISPVNYGRMTNHLRDFVATPAAAIAPVWVAALR